MENALYVKIQKETLEHLKRTEPDFGEWQTFYIPVSGKRLGGQEEGQDLAGVLNEQLINHPEVGSCLIVGSSGMGKTSFSRQWVRQCWEKAKYSDKPLVVLWIPLLSIENPKRRLLSKHLKEHLDLTDTEIKSFLRSPMQLIICCDGYDELNTTDNLYPEEVNKNIDVQMLYTCRPEVIQRDNNYRLFFNSLLKTQKQLLEYELVPFNPKQRQPFIKKFIKCNKARLPLSAADEPDWSKVQTYEDYFGRLPEVEQLISNPFLLFMSLQALPKIVKEQKAEQVDTSKQIVLTRQKIYSAFMDKWWDWQIDKLDQRKQLKGLVDALQAEVKQREDKQQQKGRQVVEGEVPKDLEEQKDWIKKLLTRFTQKLALAMFQRKLNEVAWEEKPHAQEKIWTIDSESHSMATKDGSWKKRYFGDALGLALIRSCLPLVWLGQRKQAFIHKSLLEFFAAEQLFMSAVVNVWAETGKNLDAICLVNTNETETLKLLIERVQSSKEFEQVLWEIIELSKSEPRIWRAAANAMTLLSAAGKSFTGKVLSRVHIGGEKSNERWGADLSGAILDSVDFTDADLRYVRFDHSWLHKAKLNRSIMLGVEFGELPWLQGKLACYSPDGRWLAVCGEQEVVIYRADNYQVEKHFSHQHRRDVTCLSFSPDSKQLASGSDDKIVRLWEVGTGNCQQMLAGHTDKVTSVSYRADGLQLASGSGDKTVRLWEVGTGKCQQVLAGHTDNVTSVSYRADGQQLASGSGSDDRSIRLWDISTGKCQQVLHERGWGSWVMSVSFSPNGLQLASGSHFQSISLWDVATGKIQRKLEGHTSDVNCVSYRPDGLQLASGSRDKTVRLWEVGTGKCQQVLQGHTSDVNCVSYRPDGLQLASGSRDKTVSLWEVGAGKSQQVLEGRSEPIKCVSYRLGGQQLASTISYDNTIRLWDVATGKCKQEQQEHKDSESYVSYRSDGLQRASTSVLDNTIGLYNAQNNECQQVLRGHTNYLTDVSYSPDGQQLASASEDMTIRLWSVSSGECQQVLKGHTHWVESVSYRGDGLQLASGSRDQTVRLWEVGTGKCQQVLAGHKGGETSMSFRPDGQQLVSWAGRNIHLWNVSNGQCLAIIPYTSWVNCVAWQPLPQNLTDLPAAYFLSAGCDDGSVKTWQVKQADSKVSMQLTWSSIPISALHSYEVDLQGVVGLPERHYALLYQRSGNTVKGQPSKADPATVIQQRNMQKYVPSGEIDVQGEGGSFKITSQQWLISMVREKSEMESASKGSNDNGHVYLILQGLDKNNYTVIKEFHLFLNKAASSFTFFDTRGTAAIKIHDSSPWLLKEKQSNLIARSWILSCASVEKLIERIEQQQRSKAPTYSIAGKTGYNCLSWCVKQLEEAGIPIDTNPTWRSFICAVPSDYLPDTQNAASAAAEPNTRCRIM